MAQTLLGIDIGYSTLKFALCKNGEVEQTVSIPMPVNLLQAGRITSGETMTKLIRTSMKENGIHVSKAALVLSNEISYLRTVVMPYMNTKQLVHSIPYEFADYITDGLKNYIFDYAMISTPDELKQMRKQLKKDMYGMRKKADNQKIKIKEEKESTEMNLMIAAISRVILTDMRDILRKAGLKLVKAAPAICAYIALIRNLDENQSKEYCILDLGFQSIRMYMFQGDRHIVTKVLEMGLSQLDYIVAQACNVDIQLAHNYLITNYQNCQNQDYCINTFNSIALELMRAVNFYRFSNPDSNLSDMWLCGGGAVIESFQKAISATLDIRIHQASDLIPHGEYIPDCYNYAQAIGITIE